MFHTPISDLQDMAAWEIGVLVDLANEQADKKNPQKRTTLAEMAARHGG